MSDMLQYEQRKKACLGSLAQLTFFLGDTPAFTGVKDKLQSLYEEINDYDFVDFVPWSELNLSIPEDKK